MSKHPSQHGMQSMQTRGFTVIEMLVTIGVLILVAAGVSTVFTSIADTVDNGKKLAELNRYAAQFERVMRRDFENMTRDGFLVIAQQEAPGYTADRDVQLWAGDSSDLNNNGQQGRPRRIDEIMFFARGDFETSRRAIATGMIAQSSEAAIYYGHGQKRAPDLVNVDMDTNLFFNPRATDTNIDEDARLGVAPPGVFNPNQYASDWSLLRQVTLLAQPQTAGQSLPDDVFGVLRINSDRRWLEDSQRQIALQPAARSIFNSLSQTGFSGNVLPEPADYEVPRWYRQYTAAPGNAAPEFEPMLRASGLVDIVTEDLATIRSILYGLSFTEGPLDHWDRGNILLNPLSMDQWYDESITRLKDQSLSPSPSDAASLILPVTGGSNPHFDNARDWMIDALPSLWDLNPTTPVQLSRVRYEDVPTRLLYDENDFADSDDGDRDRAYVEADQEMLGSSVFIPNCTEFIVEWSYGFIDPTITDPADPRYKKMIWYGLDRWVDANNDGEITTNGNGTTPQQDHRVAQYYNRRPAVPAIPDLERGPSPEMIVGHVAINPGFGTPPVSEIATFGHSDLGGRDWLWPKFIRITLSISDPQDQSIEQTFQMVFDVPDA
ncbi:MAG: type II secretion system protein [Phycisphaerales bacterium]|nr:type II secretion system protein [Phycisphaerales bacterium]